MTHESLACPGMGPLKRRERGLYLGYLQLNAD